MFLWDMDASDDDKDKPRWTSPLPEISQDIYPTSINRINRLIWPNADIWDLFPLEENHEMELMKAALVSGATEYIFRL